MGWLTIEPQTFCGLKEIELKIMNIPGKNQLHVTIMLSNKSHLATIMISYFHQYPHVFLLPRVFLHY